MGGIPAGCLPRSRDLPGSLASEATSTPTWWTEAGNGGIFSRLVTFPRFLPPQVGFPLPPFQARFPAYTITVRPEGRVRFNLNAIRPQLIVEAPVNAAGRFS